VQGAATELNDLRLQVEQNPDHEKREGLYQKGRQEILKRHREPILSQAFKDLYDTRVFGIAERTRLQVREGVRASVLDQIRAETSTSVNELARLAGGAENESLRREYLGQIADTLQRAQDSGAYSAERVARDKLQVEATIRAATLRVETQEIADELEAEFPKFQDRIRAAKERYSGEKEDLVVARLKDAQALQDEFKRQQDQALFDNAVTRAQAGHLTRADALELGLPGSQLNVVMGVIDRVQSGQAAASGSDRYWELRREAENPGTRETFRDRDLNAEAAKVTPKELDELKKLQLAPDTDVLESYTQKVDRALGQLELPVTPAAMAKESKDKAERARNFRRNVEAEKRRREKERGRRLTGPEIDEVIDFGTMEVVTQRRLSGLFSIFQTEAPRFTLAPGDIGLVPPGLEVEGVPADEVQLIIDALRMEGRPITQENIKAAYDRAVTRGVVP
jgi:hypothetical protein